ncbi:DDE-type integrase/transposase/recombinase [Thermocrinis sp.]|jgi:transposase-like protein|uniref:DDE-type integrase/transposase/recombinase n=1 Tax=Thermocrinis sp. TaxID=2024383 RepID=UPI003C10B2B2
MKARQVIEEILNKVFKWQRIPVSLKAEAVLLYSKGLSLRAVRKFLLHIREWFHVVGRALQAVYTIAIWVYVDETKIKIKARDRTYYLWLAVDEKGLPVFVHLSGRRDAWTAKLVLYNTKAKGCTTDKGSWYVSAVKGLAMEWPHETFGKRNVVERRFPWNAKYETVYRWLASFIVIYTIMNLKS